MVFVDGISFIPNQGIHTQNIPPITSVSDNKVSSAAGICFDAIEYSINPRHTKVPCVANKASFFPVDKKFKSLEIMIINENKKQNNPAIATVVNLGVSFLHLKLTENTENPIDDIIPNISPNIEVVALLSKAIIIIPVVAINIEIHTLIDICSFKNKKPSNAVMKGIDAKHKRVTATEVLVTDNINVIMPIPKPIPPTTPETPIFL